LASKKAKAEQSHIDKGRGGWLKDKERRKNKNLETQLIVL
jgi:hypothetical protein